MSTMLSDNGNPAHTLKTDTMEDVLSQFQSTALSSQSENTTSFDGLYKNWGRLGHQEQRRKEILDTQRRDRKRTNDAFRGIIKYVQQLENHEVSKNSLGLRTAYYRPNIYVAGFTEASKTYRNILMMSEWLVEKPEAFDKDWFVVPCPKGTRSLVVASQGLTKVYNKYGRYQKSCRTALPGGNPCDPKCKTQCAILDCVYVEITNTMYILDLLSWNDQPMADGETDFRDFWLKSQIEEIPELRTINVKNKILFEVIPKHNCDMASLNKVMNQFPFFKNHQAIVDGLLFYHKKAHYVSGETPLVGWLYPYMVNEVLGSDITVNSAYLLEKPLGYVNQMQFIQEFEKKNAKRKQKMAQTVTYLEHTSNEDGESSNQETRNGPTDAEMVEEA